MKEEMRRLNSVIMKCADLTKVPAGGALAVDREKFAAAVTGMIKQHPKIRLVTSCEVTQIPEGICIIATGPLTSDPLSESIKKLTGEEYLHFFDAAAPIVTYESIDTGKVYRGHVMAKAGTII